MPHKKVPNWTAMIERAAKLQHVSVEDFAPGDAIVVQTANRRYTFTVIDPARRRVEMTSDHPKWPGPIKGCLQGSLVSPFGSTLSVGRIAVGLGVVFSSPTFVERGFIEIRLSPTRAVFYRGVQLLPHQPAGIVH